MSKILSQTGVSVPECNVCFDNEADWDFEVGENKSKVSGHFYICRECAKTLIESLVNHYPEKVDLPYIWFLRTSKSNDKNEDSIRIQELIKDGLEKLDKYKKEEIK